MSTVDKINLGVGQSEGWGDVPVPAGGCGTRTQRLRSPGTAMEPRAAWGQLGAANKDMGHPALGLAPSLPSRKL